jgi:CRISPR-associated protein Csd1
VSALADVAFQIHRWFDVLRIARGPSDPEYPSPSRLLESMAIQAKADNIPSNLGADTMCSVLIRDTFPSMRIGAAEKRCRAGQQVTYFRATAIKACLNRPICRSDLTHATTEKEMTIVFDRSSLTATYRLGRLFAVQERIKEESSAGLSASDYK